jgi:hypothetical protein
MRITKILAVGYALFISIGLWAQPSNLDSVKNELYKINKVFDSSQYLGFNVNILYSSDTIYGKYESEEMSGTYILNNRNVYYKMGNIEYAQNDSFVFTIYHDDKTLIMSKETLPAASSLFPLREFVDSTISWYDTAYSISISDEGESKVIRFIATQSGLPYQQFAVFYDETTNYPEKMEVIFLEPLQNLGDVTDTMAYDIQLKPVNKKMVISFTDYFNPSSLDMLESSTYIYYDRNRKKYMPSVKMKGYRFITSGLPNDQFDETVELYPPPGQ